MSVRIIQGDCRDVLKTLPSESVHCVVTSPPYWGLRDYGVAGQIGLEPSYAEFVEQMVALFREVRRVLRSDGTLWLNLGDSYASGQGGGGLACSSLEGGTATQEAYPFNSTNRGKRHVGDNKNPNAMIPVTGPNRAIQAGLKPKDLCGIPWRVAFALQADGWWLRQDIIWSKPNPMPESVTDRCTKAHEYLFLLSKSERYFYDAEAIKEDASDTGRVNGRDGRIEDVAARPPGSSPRTLARLDYTERGRNKRSVWEVSTSPFPEAHFATFPPALIEPCILAGCPKGGTVLDPFGGAGTTGLVADRLQRSAILIELNPEYVALAERRIHDDAPLFTARPNDERTESPLSSEPNLP